jgi:hypothetical protein
MISLEKLTRKNIWNLAPYSCARNEFSGVNATVFLDANENPFGSPLNRYPDPLQMELKQKIEEVKGIPANYTFLGNGSDEAIDLVYRCFCEPKEDNVVAIEPTYGMYKVCADINDVEYRPVLLDDAATRCDLIIGPLYSKQMDVLSEFVKYYDIRLLIPFSINAPQLTTNRNIFQVWQSPTEINEATINHFMERFKDYHPVIIDCNDSTSRKGNFTSGLRRQLELHNIEYKVTNLKSTEDAFFKSFSTTKRNVVILNTGRSQELGIAFSKLNGMKVKYPELEITMFGYTDWLMYTNRYLENLYKFDTYIPSVFYYNPLSPATQRLQQKYRRNFRADMPSQLPRFALTGFDHAYFFLRGLHKYGKTFNGAAGMFGYPPVQTPLQFERYGNGGLRNRAFLFVHYKPDHLVETIRF